MEAERLLGLAVEVAAERSLQSVLQTIVRGLASHPGVALARIWLQLPGDICESCFLSAKCRDRIQCLHLVASGGTPIASPDEDWSFLQGHFRRIPLKALKVGQVGGTGTPLLIKDVVAQSDHIARPEWVQRERIRSFAGYPFVFRDRVLGVLAIFTREPLDERAFGWLRMFADQASVAIANARAFEELDRIVAQLRQDEQELRRITDAIPHTVLVLSPDGTILYANRAVLEFSGFTTEEVLAPDFRARFFHPEDVARLHDERKEGLSRGVPFELEWRARRNDGQYRWLLIRYRPLRDEQGRILRWYATGTDIDDRKQAEDRMRNENLALREDIDRSSMFEEIVGSSVALRRVLAQVTKVAGTDSTVLIMGETGTGKELIARAIHKRSRRSTRAFIRVNCSAIPPSLIASEFFGHEKGAFTGALQRRLGRFEAADGGTIFLDEIGELPAETQIALLRVLQEREIERVGSSHPIAVDVRVLTATNRDLEAERGTLRQDLYYRLNVFPIWIPPLRERPDDIPLLVGYLVERYAKQAGKSIRTISKQTLELFLAYDWPGNVRELQNVVERAVVLCDGETFSIDESWLKTTPSSGSKRTVFQGITLAAGEKALIEAALAESQGRISGPSGAAAKLGIPRQTLESKIKALRIDKLAFRAR
jgi:formate hydrogenlyase transcriptional activator